MDWSKWKGPPPGLVMKPSTVRRIEDATQESDQRGEEETEGKEEGAKTEEDSDEGAGDIRILTSTDLRLAMIPGYAEYAKSFRAKKKKQRITDGLRNDLDRRALHGVDPVP